ncbi:MAG: cytochrome c [Thermoanaerobaculia bacterium]
MISAPGFRARLRPFLIGLLAVVALSVAALAATPDATPATGPSWLDKLGRSFDKSSLGRVGALGPNEQDPEFAAPAPKDGGWLRKGFEVRGADLFRYTCRSCHGAGGRGMAPEILPLVNLVRSTSADWQKQQGEGGADRAKLAEKLLQHQITSGGRSMPGFNFLAGDESEALLGYLEHLAAVADPKHADHTLQLPADRVGEVIVKGTCQTCHEASPATGKRPTESAIPPLSGMTASHSVKEFVAGARHRGQGGLKGKGPEVTYLRDQELEAAYFYLTAYPPR